MDSLVAALQEHIEFIHDVDGDGNCGFRAISLHRYGDQHSWMLVRLDLIKEMTDYKDLYIELLGTKRYMELLENTNDYVPSVFDNLNANAVVDMGIINCGILLGHMHSDQKTPFSIKGKLAYHYCAISIVDLNSYKEPIAQYVPHAEDSVLGIVVDSRSDNFHVDIKGPTLAFLLVLAFEGGTRRNIPNPMQYFVLSLGVSSTTPSSGMVTMASMRNYGYVYVPMEKSVRIS
ncbi:hypothetical protein RIF29_34721 [Crotalaria pallida]|uniref:OTU domain-containing protein n=1 Tax=Crotalaria pallida TaxID=3830 RepID=A0AAN9EF31_CROPI